MAVPKSPPNETPQNAVHGDYVIELKRRPDPRYNGGELADEKPKTTLRVVYRNSAAGFQLISAQDNTGTGASRPQKFRASLSDSGKLRISGNVGYLFEKTRVEPFSVTQNFSQEFTSGETVHSNQGRFDAAFFFDTTISRR